VNVFEAYVFAQNPKEEIDIVAIFIGFHSMILLVWSS